MKSKELQKSKRQHELANIFFEMGMDLDLIEKVSGVNRAEFLRRRINLVKEENLTNGNNEHIISNEEN
ncbi:TPA: hypothetical protein GXZ34_04130 [bacterium]|jgi:hypothetical protein|nr:hypothetical protein [bacterium]